MQKGRRMNDRGWRLEGGSWTLDACRKIEWRLWKKRLERGSRLEAAECAPARLQLGSSLAFEYRPPSYYSGCWGVGCGRASDLSYPAGFQLLVSHLSLGRAKCGPERIHEFVCQREPGPRHSSSELRHFTDRFRTVGVP